MTVPPALLLKAKSDLERVIREGSDWFVTNQARRMLDGVKLFISKPELWDNAESVFGPNGYSPSIGDIIKTADWHRDNPSLPDRVGKRRVGL